MGDGVRSVGGRIEEGGCRQDQRAVLVRAFEARGVRVARMVDR